MKKLLFFVFTALLLVLPAQAGAVAQIETFYGPRITRADSFEVGVKTVSTLLLNVNLSEKPGRSIKVTATMTGALPLSIASGRELTFDDTNWSRLQNVEIKYNGKGVIGQKGKLILKDNLALRKEVNFVGVKADGDFTVVKGSSPPPSSDQGGTQTAQSGGNFGVGSSPFKCTTLGKTTTVSKSDEACGLARYISDPGGFVYKSWQATRSVINIVLIIALLLISFTNILRINIDTYTVKKALPNLIIGVVLANISFLIVRYLADIATVASYLFVGLANQATGGSPAISNFADFIAYGLERISVDSILTIGAGAFFLVFIFLIIGLVGVLWMAFILYFRLVAIYLLTILAPLAFIAYGIPGMEKYFKMWWQQMIKWMFMVVAMSAIFWLMIAISEASGGEQSWAKLFILYTLFFAAVTLPSKMGGAIIDKASKAFMKYSGANAARDASQKWLQDKGEQLKWSTPGLARVMAWNQAKKEEFEQKMKNKQMSVRNKADKGFWTNRTARALEKEKRLANRLENEKAATNADSARQAAEHWQDLETGVFRSEREKEIAEAGLNVRRNRQKLEFFVADTADVEKSLIIQAIRAKMDEEAGAEANNKEEMFKKSQETASRKAPLQLLADYWQAQMDRKIAEEKGETERVAKIDGQIQDLRDAYNGRFKERFDGQEMEVAAKRIMDDKETVDDKLLFYQWKKSMKDHIEGVRAWIGDDVKESPPTRIDASMENALIGLTKEITDDSVKKEIRKLAIQGNFAKILSLYKQHGVPEDKKNEGSFEVMVAQLETMKQVALTDNNRRKEMLNLLLDRMKNEGVLKEDAHTEMKNYLNDPTTGVQKQRELANLLFQHTGGFQGPVNTRVISAKGEADLGQLFRDYKAGLPTEPHEGSPGTGQNLDQTDPGTAAAQPQAAGSRRQRRNRRAAAQTPVIPAQPANTNQQQNQQLQEDEDAEEEEQQAAEAETDEENQ